MALLRDLIFIPTMSGLVNNIAVSQLQLLCYKLAVMSVRPTSPLHVVYTRQWLQIALGWSSILLWPLYDTEDWSWRLNVIVPSVVAARLFYKGYIVASSDDIEVQLLSRSSAPWELLFGPLQFACILIWLGLYWFRTQHAAIIAAAVGIGDALAPLLSNRFGRHYYQVPLSGRKTMEGSLCGVFLGTVVGSYCYAYVLGLPLLPLRIVLVYGFLAAVLEGTAVKEMDNVVMATAMHLSVDTIQELMLG